MRECELIAFFSFVYVLFACENSLLTAFVIAMELNEMQKKK